MTEEERDEALRDLAHRVEAFARSFGLPYRRLGRGRRWESLPHYLARLFGALRLLDLVVCDCDAFGPGSPHAERCLTFRYALLRAEGDRLGVLPSPGETP